MRFLGRRQPTPEDQPDDALSPLSVRDARVVVACAVAAFRDAGMETTYDGAGALHALDGRAYGLTNLAAAVATQPRRARPRTVAHHVRTLVAAERTPGPTSLDDVSEIVLPRLTPTGGLANDATVPPRYAPAAGPDLHVLAALDYPTHVATLATDEALDVFGGWETVGPLALSNLRRLPAPEHARVDTDPERTDAAVHVLAADDFHGATRLLLLDELLASTLGVEAPADGVLFAVPNRHLLAVHVLEGLGVVTAVQVLARLARGEHDDAPGPVSPYVYYRSPDGAVEQVTRTDDDGTVVLDATGALGTALTRLGLLEE